MIGSDREKLDKLKDFLVKRINELKKELEHYEHMLNLLDSMNVHKPLVRKETGTEIRQNDEVVASVKKGSEEVIIHFSKPADPDHLKLESLREKVSLMAANEEVNIEIVRNDQGKVSQIIINELKEPGVVEAVYRIAQAHLKRIYRRH